ncbi:MAG: cytochrome P450 [Chitinophagales bacterium]
MENVSTGCPYHAGAVAKEFEPYNLKNPFPLYKKAREEEPVFYNEELDYWVVTRHEDIKAIFTDWKTFTSENAQSPLQTLDPRAKKIMDDAGMIGLSGLSGRIPPDHTRIRRIVGMGFNISRFKKLEPEIRALAQKQINSFKNDGKAEIVKQLAYDLPALVIFKLLGVPDEDVDKVKDWAVSRLMITWGNLTPEEQIFHAENIVRYFNYCKNLVALRHENPTDDLPGDLVRYQLEGNEITDHEIATICYSVLFAGHETTTTLIGNSVRELLLHRESWEKICEDPKLITKAVEEVLRYSPSIVAWRRKSTEDAVIGGIKIPKDSNFLLVMGSGNRDEEVFEDGETFQIERKGARNHLSFGYGIHFCIGSALAKLEAKIVLEELTKAIPNLQLKEDQSFEFAPNTSFRAPVAVEVEWEV